MDCIYFTCKVEVTNATDNPLTVKVLYNNTERMSVDVITSNTLIVDIPDIEDATHKIDLVVSGKNSSHSKVNNDNTVTSTELIFSDFNIDGTSIDSIVQVNPLPYTHNFNGAGSDTTEKFYGTAGCNGTITLEFTTPFYLWLLENM